MRLLKSNRNLKPFRKYLLDPEVVHKLISITNAGHVQVARDFINRAELLLQEIQKARSKFTIEHGTAISLLSLGRH